MKVNVGIVILVSTFTGLAQSKDNHVSTGNALANTCRHYFSTDSTSTFLDGVCFGYIVGVDVGVADCEGENVTYGQEIKVVLKYMDDHPEQLDQPSSKIINRALLAAFPCSK